MTIATPAISDALRTRELELKPIEPSLRPRSERIAEVDALRGIAAFVVVLYHYTQRYGEISVAYPGLYPYNGAPLFQAPWGRFGVQLFFMISGFVILMTARRVGSVREFAVSRLARLFPAFWAACILTYAFTHWLGLPVRLTPLKPALLNLTMVPTWFGAWYIDPVYWTLLQEMIFYAIMGVLVAGRWQGYAQRVLAVLVVGSLLHADVRLGASIGRDWSIHPPLEWFSLFLIGMVYFDVRGGFKVGHGVLLALCAADILRRNVLRAGPRDWDTVTADGLSAAALFVASRWRIPLLTNRVLVFFGTISYCLYLIHQNLGYALLRHAYEAGVSANVAIGAVLVTVTLLAAGMSYGIERPAWRGLRRWLGGPRRETAR